MYFGVTGSKTLPTIGRGIKKIVVEFVLNFFLTNPPYYTVTDRLTGSKNSVIVATTYRNNY